MSQSIFDFEKSHLEFVKKELQENIERMSVENIELAKRVKDQNRLMGEQYGSAPGDFDQAVEFSQQLMMEKQMLEQKGMEDKQLEKYKHLFEKLYFARIDFKESNESIFDPIYIGYGNFMDHKSLEIYIYDWRTPIASVFYDYQTGPVMYKAPNETIYGEVSLKRQFEIKNQTLISVYDTQNHVVDEKLLEVLGDRTAGQMGQIVETIQSEQNKIIREQQAKALFVEGIAGSGKTVVALHRIAYLMYHGIKGHLDAHQVLILSPNAIFSDYISKVIPDLGEKHVSTLTLEDIMDRYLDNHMGYETRYERLERNLAGKLTDLDLLSDEIKESHLMSKLLIEFVELYAQKHISFTDVYYGDALVYEESELKKLLEMDLTSRPLIKRLDRIKERIKFMAKDIEEADYRRLIKAIREKGDHPFDYKAVARIERMKKSHLMNEQIAKITSINAMSIYKALLKMPSLWVKHFSNSNVEHVCSLTLKQLDEGKLSPADLTVIAYIHFLVSGEVPLKEIRHIIVDESQDYSLMAYSLLSVWFKKSHFTILGDAHQTLQGLRSIRHHDQISQVMGFEEALHANLTVGYRNIQSIGALCLSLFQGESGYQMVERPGGKPRTYEKLDDALDDLIKRKIPSIAIITKTMKRALEVYHSIKETYKASLVHENSKRILPGLNILPVYMAKGMEFDAVIVLDANDKTYLDERDRQLLYVCASRALHDLCFVKNGSLTPLLDTSFLAQ